MSDLQGTSKLRQGLEHDPLCPLARHRLRGDWCRCDLIADVGERIAAAIEAHADAVAEVQASGLGAGPQEDDYYSACYEAARIARNGGRDD